MARPRFAPGAFYKVEIQDAVVGLFSECSGLSVEYEVLTYAAGGDDFVHQLRGRKKYTNLTLKRGVTDDKALATWFGQTKKREDRGAVTVSLLDRKSTNVRRWSFARAHPIRWVGPTLASNGSGIGSETLEIAHEGFLEL